MKPSEAKRLPRDLALIGAFLLIAAVLFVVMRLNQTEGAVAVVRVDGQETGRYDLHTDGRYELNGGSNILIIQDGKAFLEDANCPDLLCVKQGKISASGQVITCLPNRLTVTIYGAEGDGVDIVTF